MSSRLRGHRCGLSLVLLTLVIGAAPGLCAQDGDLPPAPENQSKPQDVADESAAPTEPGGSSILDLDIEQLGTVQAKIPASFDVEVTSVTRSESTVGKSPAAVFVITQEMIRRSGVTSLPEALRMAPGVFVARNTANQWAITVRGFNSRFSSNVLVMIDGRAVYNPFFNGVFWEVQDYPLQDIERIEVIRGPGATIWGENAVNGVISIITKSSQDTQGTLVSAGGGNVDQAINTIRHGDQTQDGWSYRVFGRQTERGPGFVSTGAHDDWRLGHLGFRADRDLKTDKNDRFTIQGDIFTSTLGESGVIPTATPPFSAGFVDDVNMAGGNLLTRWSQQTEESSTFLQCYYDRLTRDDAYGLLTVNTFDVEYQNRILLAPGNHLTIGLNTRRYLDEQTTYDAFVFSATPQDQSFGRYGATIQDEIELWEDRVTLYVGSKISTNTFTGLELQPGVRAIWTINPQRALWASVSRAVRLPSRVERGLYKNLFDPVGGSYVQIFGSPAVDAQDLMAYELGYRAQPSEWFSWDAATFYNVYTDLIGIRFAGFQPGSPPFFVPFNNLQFGNSNDAQMYGFETSFTLDMTDNWRLRGWYSFLEIFASGEGGQDDFEGDDPQNQAYLMSTWNLTRRWDLDLMGRYVDFIAEDKVNRYLSMDARLGFRPNDCWEFSVVGQNLLDGHHPEFNEFLTNTPSEVPRGVYFQAVWRH